jgi:hypothetical protein
MSVSFHKSLFVQVPTEGDCQCALINREYLEFLSIRDIPAVRDPRSIPAFSSTSDLYPGNCMSDKQSRAIRQKNSVKKTDDMNFPTTPLKIIRFMPCIAAIANVNSLVGVGGAVDDTVGFGPQ